jgi:hypothetical protein
MRDVQPGSYGVLTTILVHQMVEGCVVHYQSWHRPVESSDMITVEDIQLGDVVMQRFSLMDTSGAVTAVGYRPLGTPDDGPMYVADVGVDPASCIRDVEALVSTYHPLQAISWPPSNIPKVFEQWMGMEYDAASWVASELNGDGGAGERFPCPAYGQLTHRAVSGCTMLVSSDMPYPSPDAGGWALVHGGSVVPNNRTRAVVSMLVDDQGVIQVVVYDLVSTVEHPEHRLAYFTIGFLDSLSSPHSGEEIESCREAAEGVLSTLSPEEFPWLAVPEG